MNGIDIMQTTFIGQRIHTPGTGHTLCKIVGCIFMMINFLIQRVPPRNIWRSEHISMLVMFMFNCYNATQSKYYLPVDIYWESAHNVNVLFMQLDL